MDSNIDWHKSSNLEEKSQNLEEKKSDFGEKNRFLIKKSKHFERKFRIPSLTSKIWEKKSEFWDKIQNFERKARFLRLKFEFWGGGKSQNIEIKDKMWRKKVKISRENVRILRLVIILRKKVRICENKKIWILRVKPDLLKSEFWGEKKSNFFKGKSKILRKNKKILENKVNSEFKLRNFLHFFGGLNLHL